MKYFDRIIALREVFKKPHPRRDWYFVLGINLFFGAILAGVALYVFVGIQAGFVIVPEYTAPEPMPSISRDALEGVLQDYNERFLNFEAGNYFVPDIKDPSDGG